MMKNQDKISADSAKLRHMTAELMKKKLKETASRLASSEAAELMLEFEKYHAELDNQYKELEQAKKQSEENAAKKYAELYDFAPSGYFTLTKEGVITKINLHGATMLKQDRSQLQNKRFDQFVSNDTKPIFKQFLSLIFNRKESNSCELTLPNTDGTIMFVQLKGMITDNGEHCLVNVDDITEHKQTREALKESNVFMNSMINAIPIPVFYKNKEGRYLGFNKSFSTKYGQGSNEFIGKTVFDIAPGELAAIYHAKDMELFQQPGVQVYDSQLKDSNGIIHDVVYHKATFSDSSGEVQGLIGVIQDVTENKRTEELLFNERLLLRTLIDNIPDSIYSKDLNCCKTIANLADVKFMGASSEAEVVGKNDFDVYPKELAEKFFADDQSVLQTGKPVFNREEYILNKDGTKRWLLSSKLPLRNKDGLVNGLVGIGRDITSRKQAEEQLQYNLSLTDATFESIYSGILVVNKQGKIIKSNNQFARMWDIPQQILETGDDKKLQEYIIGQLADPREFAEKVAELYSTPDAESLDLIYFNDGRIFERISKPMYIGGIPEGRVWSFFDITARVQADNVLHESQQIIENIINTIPVRVFWKDTNLVYLGCNKIFANDAGFDDPKYIIGQDDYKMAWHDQAELYRSDDQQVIKSGKPNLLIEEIQTTPKGDTITLLTSKIPLRNSQGDIVGVLGTYIDITERKQAEKALLESEALYRNLVEKLPDGVYKSTSGGKFVEVNPAMVKMLGYNSKEELMAIDITNQLYYEPADRENVELQEKLEKVGIYRMKKKDGSEIWVEDHGWLNFDENLKILYHEGIMRDVTESKHAELALQESEILYRNLVEKLPDGVYKSTHDGKFVEVNPAMVKMLGYESKEDLMSIDITTQLYLEPVDRERMVLQEKSEGMGVYQLKRKDGSAIWVEDHGWHNTDEEGKIVFHEGILRDITERKHAENALEFEHYLLNTLMNNIPAHIYFKDRESRFIRINKSHAESFRLSDPRQVVGKTDFDFFTEEHAKLAYHDEQEIIRTGHPVRKEEKATRPNQPDTWFSTIKMPLLDKDKNISGTFGISMDITESKQAENEIKLKNEELLKLNFQKDKFFSIIAHDLRGPFSGILGLTKIMAEGLAGMTLDEIQKIAIVIRNSASNLYTLLGNLLEWSSMQRGLTAYVPTSIILKPKIIEHLVLPVEMANDKSIVVSYDIPDDLVIFADENMFAGIIRNLMTNAVKFTPREGKIHVTANSTSGNMVQISVKDSGIGMNQSMIDNLFNLGMNTSRKGTEGEASTGLGLMICKDFVENHGGELWVDSKVGEGSTFHFTIPLYVDSEEKAKRNKLIPTEETVVPVKKLKILIAEDDETSELLLSLSLKKFSRDILKARTGSEAVNICRDNSDIDLILMDIKMPVMNGYEASRLIRQFNTKVVIIAQTAFGKTNDFDSAKEAGCNDYISKPVNLDTLSRLIIKHFKD